MGKKKSKVGYNMRTWQHWLYR